MTTKLTLDLLGVPETFVDDMGGVTLSSYWPIIRQVLDATDGPVVEIGADRGFCTVKLAEACAAQGRDFHSVDPSPSDGVNDIPGVVHHRKTSFEFFEASDVNASMWIVDGDHNYATVIGELENIVRMTGESEAAIFLHDAGWPWGRRDLWYNPSEAPANAVLAGENRSISLDVAGNVPSSEGIFLGAVSAVAAEEGGARNGVMTAIEDFLASKAGSDWEFRWTPLFYGFVLLTKKGTLDRPEFAAVREAFAAFETNREIIASAELNRLRLLLTLNQKWASGDAYAMSLNARLSKAEAILRTPLGKCASLFYRLAIKVRGK